MSTEETPAIVEYIRARNERDALERYLYGGDSRAGTPYERMSYDELRKELHVAHERARACFARLSPGQMAASA